MLMQKELSGLTARTGASILACLLIAEILAALSGNRLTNYVLSFSIGLTIYLINQIGMYLICYQKGYRKILVFVSATLAGSLLGAKLGLNILNYIAREQSQPFVGNQSDVLLSITYLGLLFGGLISFIHYSRGELADRQKDLKEKEHLQVLQEKQLAVSQLKLIQAQIEPHFLFNTLANINELIASDTNRAQMMLQNLNQYLRTSLARTRAGETTLEEELLLIDAYLSIVKIRMGSRLEYSFEIEGVVKEARIPPLLLQPIVENSIRHGLEPKIDGGTIVVSARLHNGRLILEVSDTGVGFSDMPREGTGLTNIRNRLNKLYGDSGRIEIKSTTGGTSVTIDSPFKADNEHPEPV